jgi:hypothetical protein
MGLKIAGYSVCAVTSESVLGLVVSSHLLFFFVFSAPRPISKGRISVQKEIGKNLYCSPNPRGEGRLSWVECGCVCFLKYFLY